MSTFRNCPHKSPVLPKCKMFNYQHGLAKSNESMHNCCHTSRLCLKTKVSCFILFYFSLLYFFLFFLTKNCNHNNTSVCLFISVCVCLCLCECFLTITSTREHSCNLIVQHRGKNAANQKHSHCIHKTSWIINCQQHFLWLSHVGAQSFSCMASTNRLTMLLLLEHFK